MALVVALYAAEVPRFGGGAYRAPLKESMVNGLWYSTGLLQRSLGLI